MNIRIRLGQLSILWLVGLLSLQAQSAVLFPGETLPTGTQPISVTAADMNNDGNLDLAVANQTSNTVSVLLNQLPPETVAPIGTITIDAGASATNTTAVALTLTCDDGAGSGCAQMQFSNDNVSFDPLVANTTSALWILATGADGVRTVYARFVDATGNLVTRPHVANLSGRCLWLGHGSRLAHD